MAKAKKRSGAGRPSTGRTKELRLYVTPEADGKLSAIAKLKKVPKGEILERLLENTYHVRFGANKDLFGYTKNWDEWNSRESPDKRSYYDDSEYIPNRTFFDTKLGIVWFEAKLPYVPQIGWGIACDAEGLDWNKDIYPRVIAITFHMKLNMFVVELDRGLDNQLKIIESLKEKKWVDTQKIETPHPEIRDSYFEEYTKRRQERLAGESE